MEKKQKPDPKQGAEAKVRTVTFQVPPHGKLANWIKQFTTHMEDCQRDAAAFIGFISTGRFDTATKLQLPALLSKLDATGKLLQSLIDIKSEVSGLDHVAKVSKKQLDQLKKSLQQAQTEITDLKKDNKVLQ